MEEKKKLIFMLMVIVMLYGIKIIASNEYLYAMTNIPVSDLKYYTIDSEDIEKRYNDKLIVTRGRISTGDTQVTDDKFEMSVKTAKLVRVVETYTCNKICYSEKECEIVKDWTKTNKTSVIDGDPTCIKPNNDTIYENQTFYNVNTKLGNFKLSLEYIDVLPAKQQILNLNEKTAQKLNLYIKDSSYTTTPPNEEPKAGDVRISFYYVKPQEFTVMGTQNKDTLESYRRQTGFIISYLTDKDLTGKQMLKTMKDTPYEPPGVWKNRFLGIILTMIGCIFSTIFGYLIYAKKSNKISILRLLISSLSMALIIDMILMISIWRINYLSAPEEIVTIIILVFSTIIFIISLILKDNVTYPIPVVTNSELNNKINTNYYQKEVQNYKNPYKNNYNNNQNNK